MSRSTKKPICKRTKSGCRVGEKQDKRLANRKLRRKVREGFFDLTLREVSNLWNFRGDGKCNWQGTDYEEQATRK